MGADFGGGRLRIGACLSLTGRFAPFGRQAAHGLRVWAELDGHADVLVEDDGSDVHQLRAVLPGLAARCDLLLGPYSTVLMRAAGDIAAEKGWLVWNHGGSGDDVETAHPGHVVSVLTPTSRYMEPFLIHHIAEVGPEHQLRIAHGKGRFGRQVASGAEAYARQLGFSHVHMGPVKEILADNLPNKWTLVAAGTFEDDTQTVIRARGLDKPPQVICAVAAGVREFTHAVERPDGILGVAQWFRGSGHAVQLGPDEHVFLDAYHAAAAETPDYPAIQAAAAASLAAHCAREVGNDREPLWRAAALLDTSTLYGAFKIDQTTGEQTSHQTALTCWLGGQLVAISNDSSKHAGQLVVAAVVTSEQGVLVGRRVDGNPLWTFIAGKIEPGESPTDAAVREVKEEVGVGVVAGQEIARRVHPRTGRTIIYVAARPIRETALFLGDRRELAEARWVRLAEAQALMQPDGMFHVVRDYLAKLLP